MEWEWVGKRVWGTSASPYSTVPTGGDSPNNTMYAPKSSMQGQARLADPKDPTH